MALTGVTWTLDDYHRIVEAGVLDGRPVELLNGEIVVMPPEGTPHAAYSQEGADYLRAVLGSRAKIREAKPITLPNSNSEPEPDIAVVVPHAIEVYLQHHPYPEDIFWLIEFSNSSLNKDLEDKSKVYAAAGISEYWVVNLQKMKLVVLRSPVGGEYESKQTLETGTIAPLAFPEVSITVGRLLGRSSSCD
jgi:Uma2 family endonuclease